MTRKVEALFVSDVHLGSRGCKADLLLSHLQDIDPEKIFIVGDFIDGWLLKKRHFWPQSHTNVVRKMLSYAKRGKEVYYITGNHDEFLRNYGEMELGNLVILDEMVYEGMYIAHGDKFDAVVQYSKWLSMLGSIGYEILLVITSWQQKIRKALGLRPKSLSKVVKNKFKEAVKFITSFEDALKNEAKRKGCHTVICGHIHTPKIEEGEITYVNTGDWVDSCSFVIYDKGKFELVHAEIS
jgi:UDP-2,3-diacylglucosamine pyrophosphatase LpxH